MVHSDGAQLTPGTRGGSVVRGATARLCDALGNHKGQGLVLGLDEEVVVLTCHHVIAGLAPDAVRVALPDGGGGLGPPVEATLDASRSRPARDAVVLRVSVDAAPSRPLLHALDPAVYEGTLPKRATGYSHMATQTFDARVGAATGLDLEVSESGGWPDPPQRYVIPAAFRLAEPTDARAGVSGSVVAYEGGVLGLAHFARAAGQAQQRELYLVPLSTWAEGWEELGVLIEPLIDQALRDAALVRRVRDVRVGISDLSAARDPDLVIAGYRRDVYADPPQSRMARQALAGGGLLIIGRPKSGKTRLAWQLIREFPDAVLVMPLPHAPQPPAEFETAGLSGRQVVVLCDDLHSVAERTQPLRWRERLRPVASAVYLLATIRDGAEWKRVRDNQTPLLDAIDEHRRVFVSHVGDDGEDLPLELARDLARQLGLGEAEFQRRFDGTPGSLTLDLRDMRSRYERLREEQLGGLAASRLLDSLKLLHAAGQARLDERLTQAVAEQIRGDTPIAAETWERLCRRTQEEGFGAFSAGDFRTYRPYLEECVHYTPPAADFDRLFALLCECGEWLRLVSLGIARAERGEPAPAKHVLQAAINSGDTESGPLAAFNLGVLLEQEDVAGARGAFQQAIDSGHPDHAPRAAVGLGVLLAQQGDVAGARGAYQQAIDSGHPDGAPAAVVNLGVLLTQQGDVAGARGAFQQAIDSGHPDHAPRAAFNLGVLLAQQGDVAGARGAYQQAIDSGHPDHAPRAVVNLGVLLEEQGDVAGARGALQQAIDSGHPDHAPRAVAGLGWLLAQQGDVAGARGAYQQAIDSGHPDAAPVAAFVLGVLLEQQGDVAGARGAYQQAIDSGHPDHAPRAAFNLGVLLAQQEDIAGARGAYQQAIDSAHPDHAPRAAFNLGVLLEQQEDIAGARGAYQQAIDSGHSDAGEKARARLKELG